MIQIWKTEAADSFEVRVRRLFVVKKGVRHFVLNRGGWENIEKVNSSVKCFHPIRW